MTLAGLYRLQMILIVVEAGGLAAGPIARGYAEARARPHIDTRHILRSIGIDATLYATVAATAAYLEGTVVARLWGL